MGQALYITPIFFVTNFIKSHGLRSLIIADKTRLIRIIDYTLIDLHQYLFRAESV